MSIITIFIVVAASLAAIAWLMRDKLRGKPVPDVLRVGNAMPEFVAVDPDGHSLDSSSLRGRPAVVLFVRGSWCPFCSKQVKNLTRYYKEITDAGARLILVTPRPLETTQRVADFFDVRFEFWLDESLSIGRKLGIVHAGGVPTDRNKEYGEDTLWPTSLVIDADGVIRHTELSRFIADRPDPQKLLSVVKNL